MTAIQVFTSAEKTWKSYVTYMQTFRLIHIRADHGTENESKLLAQGTEMCVGEVTQTGVTQGTEMCVGETTQMGVLFEQMKIPSVTPRHTFSIPTILKHHAYQICTVDCFVHPYSLNTCHPTVKFITGKLIS